MAADGSERGSEARAPVPPGSDQWVVAMLLTCSPMGSLEVSSVTTLRGGNAIICSAGVIDGTFAACRYHIKLVSPPKAANPRIKRFIITFLPRVFWRGFTRPAVASIR